MVIKYYQYNYKLSVCKEIRASLSRCLTSIRTRIVSGIKLARCKEIVSLPPEKMCSTAMAKPAALNLVLKVTQHEGDSILTRDGKHITNKLIEVWELWSSPQHHWRGLQNSKSSWGSLKYSSTSLTIILSFIWYREVKLTFSGDPLMLLFREATEDKLGVGCKLADCERRWCAWLGVA